jgi:hypothetical protein
MGRDHAVACVWPESDRCGPGRAWSRSRAQSVRVVDAAREPLCLLDRAVADDLDRDLGRPVRCTA